MHNKLTFYSVLLLVGLAVASGLIFVNNPFSGTPASASPGAQSVITTSATTAVSTSTATSTATSSTATAPVPVANGFGDDAQHGGTSSGDHDYHSDFGPGGATGNSTVTTTTTTSIIYSRND